MLVKKLVASALYLAAISSASAFSLGDSSEGQRFLILMIQDDSMPISSVKEIKLALNYGGRINIDFETARKADPNFRKDLVGSVFCDSQRKAKDFDPDKAEPNCIPSNAALLNWAGKHGWSLSQGFMGNFIMTKPWSKFK